RAAQPGAERHAVGGAIEHKPAFGVQGPDTYDLVPARGVQRLTVRAKGERRHVGGGAPRLEPQHWFLVARRQHGSLRRSAGAGKEEEGPAKEGTSGQHVGLLSVAASPAVSASNRRPS